MIFINTKKRSNAVEIMDDFALEGETLRDALDKIAKINQLLGGNKLTLQGVAKLLENTSKDTEIKIVDIGCGNGDMLRYLADFAKKNNWNFDLVGVDANNFTINHAVSLSKQYSTISYLCEDILETKFDNLKYDIVLCTLTLHHFKVDEIERLLAQFYKNATIGIVVNDLHRSVISYRLFQALCFVFQLNKMSKEDGLVSILRGFKRSELIAISKKLNFKKYTINWKWAFRYQCIVKKI
jgi:2-polyprenyl-3-methyl-5-hydroxy-6-metoxy-1,4-benzoquinol methylase